MVSLQMAAKIAHIKALDHKLIMEVHKKDNEQKPVCKEKVCCDVSPWAELCGALTIHSLLNLGGVDSESVSCHQGDSPCDVKLQE